MTDTIMKKSKEGSKITRLGFNSVHGKSMFTTGIPTIENKEVEVIQVMLLPGDYVLVEYIELGKL